MKDETRRELREQARELASIMQGLYTVDKTKYDALLEAAGASFVYYLPLLLDEVEHLREVARAVSTQSWYTVSSRLGGELRQYACCPFPNCEQETLDDWRTIPHTPECPVTKARALLTE